MGGFDFGTDQPPAHPYGQRTSALDAALLDAESWHPRTMAVIIYGREGCPMCADAKQWLADRKIAFTFREIFEQPLSANELHALAKKNPNGAYDLYAPKGARKVGLSEDGRAFTSDQIVNLQVANPDLIRYPLFEFNNRLLFGFHQATRDALMTLAGESR
jgi:arsenate reductase-like glutaredoxin family protein